MLQTLSLNDSAAVATSFVMKSVNGQSVVYMAPTSSSTEPKTLTVDVVNKDLNSSASDRVTVRAQIVMRDTVTGVPVAANFSAQLVLPRNTVMTDKLRKDCYSFVMNYLAISGAFDSLADGIIP